MIKKEEINLEINFDLLPIKYVLGIQTNFDDYPTNLDFLFDLVCVLSKNELLYKEWYVTEIWGDLLEVDFEKLKTTYQSLVRKLVKEGYVDEVGGPEKTVKHKNEKFVLFKLNKHPWMFKK